MTSKIRGASSLAGLSAAALVLAGLPAAAAPSILDSWGTIATPAPPEAKPVTLDSGQTALLILDMLAVTCTDAARPRCAATVPQVQQLLTQARARHMLVVFSAGQATSTVSPNPVAALTPQAGEPMVRAPVDKFFNSDLEKILSDRKITSVIVTGTSADGAVLYTASSAALRGLTAVVPLDGMSSVNPFAELYTAWHLKNAPAAITSHVTLTKTDLITLR